MVSGSQGPSDSPNSGVGVRDPLIFHDKTVYYRCIDSYIAPIDYEAHLFIPAGR